MCASTTPGHRTARPPWWITPLSPPAVAQRAPLVYMLHLQLGCDAICHYQSFSWLEMMFKRVVRLNTCPLTSITSFRLRCYCPQCCKYYGENRERGRWVDLCMCYLNMSMTHTQESQREIAAYARQWFSLKRITSYSMLYLSIVMQKICSCCIATTVSLCNQTRLGWQVPCCMGH